MKIILNLSLSLSLKFLRKQVQSDFTRNDKDKLITTLFLIVAKTRVYPHKYTQSDKNGDITTTLSVY